MKQEVKQLSAPAVRERIYLYDNVKCLAIFLVVIGHAINFLTDFDGNNLEKSMYSLIYAFHMPLFIFISGLFVKPMNEETQFPKYKVLSFVLIGIVLIIAGIYILKFYLRRQQKKALDIAKAPDHKTEGGTAS